MINKLQKLTMTTGVLALVFILPMAFSAVTGSSGGRNGIVKNYCSIPFWICISVFVLYVQVVNPLRDIPYLNSPHTVSLADVNFYYSNISDSPTIEISGIDAGGREETFSISRKEFKEGETLLQQAAKSGGAQAVTADITYLPYSETVLDMDMKIADAAKR